MALAKDLTPSCSFYGNIFEPDSTSLHFTHISPSEFDDYIKNQDGDVLDSPSSNKIISNQVISHSPPLSSSSSANSSIGLPIHHHSYDEDLSLINFKTGYDSFLQNEGSMLSFEPEELSNDNFYQKISHCSANMSLLEEANCLQATDNEWLYGEASVAGTPQESGSQQACFNKRPHMEEENVQAVKKPCTTKASKKFAKSKSSPTKDTQSVAAKNRRERISERLKILQDLVPNGSKVDLVTMLEKAINYVKFLQLQVKVLATDEFWPSAGGKAPDISQVREAIDAILSSQRSTRS